MSEETQGLVRAIDYFGPCPVCHAEAKVRNIRRDHIFYCEKCRVKWHVGGNLFSDWRDESEDDWKANATFLAEFRSVKPYILPEYLATDDEAAVDIEERRRASKQAISIVAGPGGWYLVVVPGRNEATGGDPVDIIVGPLASEEAAETARREAILSIEQDPSFLTHDLTSAENWNLRGRLLRFLRDHEGESLVELADSLASSGPWRTPEKRKSQSGSGDLPF